MVILYGSARRSLRRILPTADLGSASKKRTCLGTLYAASWRRQCAITSVWLTLAPGALTRKSLTASPVFSSGAPTQAHSAIPAQVAATASTSVGYTLKPETRIMSFLRSTILEVARLVECADVAGAEVAVRSESGSGGFRVPPVTAHHLWTLGTNFPRL